MQRKPGVAGIQDSATPALRVRFWTADAEGTAMIKKWLHDEIAEHPMAFFGSFTNWCMQQVGRMKNPATTYRDEADKERAHHVREVLRSTPLDVPGFIGPMEGYSRDSFVRGPKSGALDVGDDYSSRLNRAQDQLRDIVWTKSERDWMSATAGREHQLGRKAKRKLARARHLAEQEMKEEEEEEKSAFGQWGETRGAVGEVEREIGLEDALTALGGPEQREPWTEVFADRTKK